jgi:DNA repair exonuclease SbcCD ATPase subunit
MDYTQALGWLDEQEGGKDASEAIRTHVTGLNKEAQNWRQKFKGATSEQTSAATELEQLRTENAQYKTRIQTLETNETELKSQASDLHKQLQSAKSELETEKGKITATETSLTEAQTKVTSLETQINENAQKLTTLESEKQTLARSLGVTEAATLAGAQPKVLQTLLKEAHQIVVENEKVFVVEGETRSELREYADANWKAFVPALFQGVPNPRLPEGGPKGSETAKGNVVNKTLSHLYGTPTAKV